MNEESLPPITVNQVPNGPDANEEAVVVPNEIGDQGNEAATAEMGAEENPTPAPTAAAAPVNNAPVAPLIPPTNHTKNSKLVVGLLVSIILILTGLAGMLIYQNNSLTNQNTQIIEELKKAKPILAPTPTPTPIPTATATPRPEAAKTMIDINEDIATESANEISN